MKYTLGLPDLANSLTGDLEGNDILIGLPMLSRFPNCRWDQLKEVTEIILSRGARPILEWDVLTSETQFETQIKFFKQVDPLYYRAIRAQDKGVLNYLKTHSDVPLQVLLDSGNHNLFGLKAYIDFFGTRAEKFILSSELTQAKLGQLIEEMPDTSFEILGLGRILLFTSPRPLLSAQLEGRGTEDEITAYGESEETPHKGFFLHQNTYGTFMFHPKVLSLVEYFPELQKMGMGSLRLEGRQLEGDLSMEKLLNLLSHGETQENRDYLRVPTLHGFFKSNKTDRILKKLKNASFKNIDDHLGEVLHVAKGNYFLVALKPGVRLDLMERYQILTPEGREISFTARQVRNCLGEELASFTGPGHLMLNSVKGVTYKSKIRSLSTGE